MVESVKDAEKRIHNLSKMRQNLKSALDDSFRDFRISIAVRDISEIIDNESTNFEGRSRKIFDFSDEPIDDDSDNTSLYIDQRQEFVEDLETFSKKIRKTLDRQRKESKKALAGLDEIDNMISKEKTALAADRIRVNGVLGQLSHAKIGEAYMMAITDDSPEPADASYPKKPGRMGEDQTTFKKRLIKAYNIENSKILETSSESQKNEIWCPISGKKLENSDMRAAHIIPYSIGETNAAYLFGSKPNEGYGIIWSEKNGLMLEKEFEKFFDDGRMVITPDPTDDNEFISIILSQDLLNRPCKPINAPTSTIHKKRLQFQTAARPGKPYLYVHALLSLLRRRRYNVPGWEKDREQVFNGRIWGTRGEWAPNSMVEVLAMEFGDSWEHTEAERGLGEFPGAKSPEEGDYGGGVYVEDEDMEDEDMEDEDMEDEDMEDEDMEDEDDE